MLAKILPLYSHWLGGKLGNGQQIWSLDQSAGYGQCNYFLLKTLSAVALLI